MSADIAVGIVAGPGVATRGGQVSVGPVEPVWADPRRDGTVGEPGLARSAAHLDDPAGWIG